MKNLIFQPLSAHNRFIFDIYSPSLISKKCESFFWGFFVQILISGMMKRRQQTMMGICEQKLLEDSPKLLQKMLEKRMINKTAMRMTVIRKKGKQVLSIAIIEFNFYVFWQFIRIAFSLLIQNRTFWLIPYLFYSSHSNYPENLLYLNTQIGL